MKTITVTNGGWFDSNLDPTARKYLFRVATEHGWTIRVSGQHWS